MHHSGGTCWVGALSVWHRAEASGVSCDVLPLLGHESTHTVSVFAQSYVPEGELSLRSVLLSSSIAAATQRDCQNVSQNMDTVKPGRI